MQEIECDVHVIGSGFGGLASALRLSELGLRVCLSERLNYAGGCASTFSRFGYKFESGATLFSGFAPGQLFHHWIERYQWDLNFIPHEELIRFQIGVRSYSVQNTRSKLHETLYAMVSPENQRALSRFLHAQKAIADSFWPLFDNPKVFLLSGLMRSGAFAQAQKLLGAASAIRYMKWLGKPLSKVLQSYKLEQEHELVTYLDALCQITLQCSTQEAEAFFAMVALDYPLRGTGHIHGGIGALANKMAEQVVLNDGVFLPVSEVRKLKRQGKGYVAQGRKANVSSTHVVSNLVPQALWSLRPELGQNTELQKMARQLEQAWGAVMLYGVCEDDESWAQEPFHIEIAESLNVEMTYGRHIFISVSGRDEGEKAEEGFRTFVVSTHIRIEDQNDDAYPQIVNEVQERMWQNIEAFAPKLAAKAVQRFTGSPRTFERFTGRPKGAVGGIPRRAGLHHYRAKRVTELEDKHYMVGDSVFPGQSTLATAVGGYLVAEKIASRR